jgi:hypothetical protein
MPEPGKTAEHTRLLETESGTADWKRWGPYLSERAWGTVREDYSPDGSAWDFFPHDHARSRAYRWNEDGLAGVCDAAQYLCLGVALWNEHDSILKERLFGLTGSQGNHGEDVKEYYFYLDSTPTHSYMKMLYKYPQVAYPYDTLVQENQQRGYETLEFELFDALRDAFTQQRYFDVFVEYAKAAPDDIFCRITVHNRGPDEAPIHILPQIWYRNTWSWFQGVPRPYLHVNEKGFVSTSHEHLGDRWWYTSDGDGKAPLLMLFTENETNNERLFGAPNNSAHVKDGIHEAVVNGQIYRVNSQRGSKAAAHFRASIPAGESYTVLVRLCDKPDHKKPFATATKIFDQRISEADAFYAAIQKPGLTDDEKLVQRQAFAGLLWSKQFYSYDVEQWLRGDPNQPTPPESRLEGRNREWFHLNNADIISMPDKWEYPWFASWDLAFHCVPLALIDPQFAKSQLLLLGYEWYQHPNGQMPAYEWDFGDVNPPVIAWAALRVYEIERDSWGKRDTQFLERVFHKQMLYFTWWVNRKDIGGKNVFQGGFLGLDNIGVFDRSRPLPTGGHIEQSDGTSWMGMFCLNMLAIALELARENNVYEDVATKFFEHFMYIASAMNNIGDEGYSLWDDEDEFFYDVLLCNDKHAFPLKVRSLVGIIPLFAVTTVEPEQLTQVPDFKTRLEWFLANRPNLAKLVSRWEEPGAGERRLVALVRGSRMKRILRRMLDEQEFLSPYGIRSLSRYHAEHPYVFQTDGAWYTVAYLPAESDSGMFGGNSNWRGPIWMPVNYLIVEALQRFHVYYGDDFKVEYPTGSGQNLTLREIAHQIARRLVNIFLRDEANNQRRAVFGGNDYFQNDPHWRDYIHEYFHGDIGAGIGASHQTGWTALVAELIQQCGAGGDGTDDGDTKDAETSDKSKGGKGTSAANTRKSTSNKSTGNTGTSEAGTTKTRRRTSTRKSTKAKSEESQSDATSAEAASSDTEEQKPSRRRRTTRSS